MQEDDIVECVARAIMHKLADINPGHPLYFQMVARAAIEAMREPTTAMLHASTMQVPTWDNEASRRKWQAMIDAALASEALNNAT